MEFFCVLVFWEKKKKKDTLDTAVPERENKICIFVFSRNNADQIMRAACEKAVVHFFFNWRGGRDPLISPFLVTVGFAYVNVRAYTRIENFKR